MKTTSLFYMPVSILFLVWFHCEYVEAQSPEWLWAKSLGAGSEENGVSMAVDPSNGDVYSTGAFEGTVDFDPGVGVFNLTSDGRVSVFVLKLDSDGNFIWAKSMGGTDGGGGIAIAVDPSGSGDVYTTGWFYEAVDFDPGQASYILTSEGHSDIFISMLDRDGNFLWAKAIGGEWYDFVNAIAIDPASGNVYTTGTFEETIDFDPDEGVFNLTSAGLYDIFISKWNASGDFIWAKSTGGADHEYVNAIAVDAQGGVYTTGGFEGMVDFDPGEESFYLSSVGDNDIFISKLDDAGVFVWAKSIGGAAFDFSSAITIDPKDGGIYSTGYFRGTADLDPGEGIYNLTSNGAQDAFISKLNSSGHFEWAKSFGGTLGDGALSIAVDQADKGDVYITGSFRGTVDLDPGAGIVEITSVGVGDIFVSKFDAAGKYLWSKTVGGGNGEHGSCVAVDDLGNVYVTGVFYSPVMMFDSMPLANEDVTGESDDIFIAKLDNAVTALFIIEQLSAIVVCPNPANNTITFEVPDVSKGAHFSIYNTHGQKVLDQPITDLQNTIDISKLPPGMYFLRIMNDSLVQTQKLLKE